LLQKTPFVFSQKQQRYKMLFNNLVTTDRLCRKPISKRRYKEDLNVFPSEFLHFFTTALYRSLLMFSFFHWFSIDFYLVQVSRDINKDFLINELFFLTTFYYIRIKLRKGKALRKHNLHGIRTASVWWKLFISGNARCHTTDAP